MGLRHDDRVSVLRLVTDIAAPAQVCFDLSRSIDLHLESMAASGERAVGGITSGLIEAGQEVTWEARHFGILWQVTSRITEYDPPRWFVDEMDEGRPFSTFRHEHTFEDVAGRTRMTDVVAFRTRWGLPVDLVVHAYLRHLLTVRNRAIRAQAESASPPGP